MKDEELLTALFPIQIARRCFGLYPLVDVVVTVKLKDPAVCANTEAMLVITNITASIPNFFIKNVFINTGLNSILLTTYYE